MTEVSQGAHNKRRTDMANLVKPMRWFRNRSLPLLAAMVSMMLIYPWFDVKGELSPKPIVIAFAAIPMFGVLTLGRLRWGILGTAILIAGSIAVGELPRTESEAAIGGWVGLVVIFFYLMNIIIIARTIFRSTALLDDRVYGGIAVYMLTGIMFAVVHHRLGVRIPGAYQDMTMAGGGPLNWADYIYFSFTALTTSGFGDIIATNSFSRSMASIESVVGVLFPAILIARLINIEGVRKHP